MPIIRRSNCVPLPIAVCPVVAVVMLESRVAAVRQHSPHCAQSLPPDSPASQQLQTGQTTIGSGTQLDLLMMGIKMPETC